MNLGERKSRNVVDRDAKYATEYLVVAAFRIELGRRENVLVTCSSWYG